MMNVIHGLIAGAQQSAAAIDQLSRLRAATFSVYGDVFACLALVAFSAIISWKSMARSFSGNAVALRRSRLATQATIMITGLACGAAIMATPQAPGRPQIAAACAVGQSLMAQLDAANMAAMTGRQVATINDLDDALNRNCVGISASDVIAPETSIGRAVGKT